jgi:hypothetical protein
MIYTENIVYDVRRIACIDITILPLLKATVITVTSDAGEDAIVTLARASRAVQE